MKDLLYKRFNISPDEDLFVPNFDGKEKLIRRRKDREVKLDGKIPKEINKSLKKYRNGGEGFISWCEDHVHLAIYKESSTVPSWTPMHSLPPEPNPETGRSYKDMWEMQKPIMKKALAMKDGRFLHRLVVFCWMRGDGKCERKGTKIIKYDGSIVNVEDVRVGDLLMGDDNTPRKVLSLVNGKEEMFEIIPNRGESLFVTEDHMLSLQKRSQMKFRKGVHYREPGHGSVIDITVRDFMKKSKGFQNSHMLYKVPLKFDHKDVPLDPYFLGLWLGDGTANSPEITTMDPEVVEYIYDFAAKNNLIVNQKGKNGSKASTYSLTTPKGKTNPLRDLMADMYLLENKHVPEIYRVNSEEVQMQILAGILDSDGSRNRNSFDLTLKNEAVIDSIAFIARSLGFFVVKKKVKKGIKSTGFVGEYFRLGISGDCSRIPIRVEKKKCEKRSDWKNVLLTTIKEVKSIGEDEYYGFTLSGNGRYVREDFTVTHNSLVACLIQLWKFFCFPRQQIMLGANSKDQVKFVHYDIMREIIQNSPKLLAIIGQKNIQEKEMRLVDSKKRVISIVRSISSFSGIVSNITGYTFSEIFDMKNPKFFVQLDGSTRNMPNALGVIDSTVSEKSHILYKLYESSLTSKAGESNLTYFSYRCSPTGSQEDFFNPQMTQKQLDDYRRKFPPAEFARYFQNLWDTGICRLFTDEALEAMRYIGVGKKLMIGGDSIQKLLKEKNEKKRLLEIPEDERRFEVNEAVILQHEKTLYSLLSPISEIYRLDHSTYFCDKANSYDLSKLTEIFDTNWVIGCGVDRADPMKEKQDGARTMMSFVAKGLMNSRGNPVFTDENAVNRYLYINLGTIHIASSSLEDIKLEINSAEEEYNYIDVFCSERWGMFDIEPWLIDKGIEVEILHPTPAKQKEGFSELFAIIQGERFKCPPIGYPGSKNPDILFEELSTIETTPGKDWYGSPEKFKSGGIQDDSVFSLVWAIYGLRFKTVDDMQPRTGKDFLGEFVRNKELFGSY